MFSHSLGECIYLSLAQDNCDTYSRQCMLQQRDNRYSQWREELFMESRKQYKQFVYGYAIGYNGIYGNRDRQQRMYEYGHGEFESEPGTETENKRGGYDMHRNRDD